MTVTANTTPRARLAPHIARSRARIAPPPREVRPIEVVTRSRTITIPGAGARVIHISLARVRGYFEEETR